MIGLAAPAIAIVLEDEVKPGGVISDGNGDIFDNFGFLSVNGIVFKGAVTQLGPALFSIAPQDLGGGLAVSGQVAGFDELGLAGGDPDYRVVRWWFTVSNSGAGPVPLTAFLAGNLGSDSDTVQRFSSTGQPLSAATSWVVTADTLADDNRDPAFGFVQDSPGSIARPLVASLAEDNILSGFDGTLAAGRSISFVWFGTARVVGGDGPGNRGTAGNALSDITTFILGPSGVVQPALLAGGLQGPEAVVNHAPLAQSGLSVRVRKAKRSRSGVVTARGTAASAAGVSEVTFKVSGLTGKAKGTDRWIFKTRVPGSIRVTAVDAFGNLSAPARVKIRR